MRISAGRKMISWLEFPVVTKERVLRFYQLAQMWSRRKNGTMVLKRG